MTAFNTLPLPTALLQAVEQLDYAAMTPIQAASLPEMLAAHDVRAQAMTGSGKTAAFGLALLAGLEISQTRVQALVLCPTRELADQVSKEIRALARFLPNVKLLSLCGGVPLHPQLASLSAHAPHVVVGTPGRVLDLVNRGDLKLGGLHAVVLDEADRMLDMGFLDAVEKILNKTPKRRRTWLFSATYPAEIDGLSARVQNDPVAITVQSRHAESVISQQFFRVEPARKADAVVALLQQHQPEACLIFCHTKVDTQALADTLARRQLSVRGLHGDLDQRAREEALVQFANGSCRVLVATDVAARGLDIKDLPLVIAYELSPDPDVHVHRVGRTGRAGATGRVLNLVAEREQGRMQRIVERMPDPTGWSSVPEVRTDVAVLAPPDRGTLVIDAGRKDKLRPGDILGALTGDAGLRAAQVGKIDVFATRAYVAIDRSALKLALSRLRDGQIKGRRFRVRSV
ncbi:MAG: ATP-dependent RNA helicase DbpA [Oceanococcaceae bacterium]